PQWLIDDITKYSSFDIEFFLREIFEEAYQLYCDDGHTKWKLHLLDNSLVCSDYILEIFYLDWLGQAISMACPNRSILDTGETSCGSCQLFNARLTRWTIKLQEYNLIIQHIPGKENVGADTLTRYPQSPNERMGKDKIQISINKLALMEYSEKLKDQFNHLQELQRGDKKLQKIFRQVASKPNPHFCVFKGLLFTKNEHRRYLIMIPSVMNQAIVQETHERYGHMGTYKVYQISKLQYKMSNMYRTNKKIVKKCDICQKSKCDNQMTRETNPQHHLGKTALYPIKKATTETILRKITNEFIPNIGPIEQLLTDNGTQFHSKKWFQQMETLGIQTRHTTTYHPESNSVERANRKIDYDNTTSNEPVIEWVRKKLKSKAEARNKIKDQGKKFKQYKKGQQVLVKEHKLSSAEDQEIHKFFLLYKGPYTVIQSYDNNTVMLEDQHKQVIRCNIKNIKPYYTITTTEEKSLCFPPDPEQLKAEAKYRREAAAKLTKYTLEPTFHMPSTIVAKPIHEVEPEEDEPPSERPAKSTAPTEYQNKMSNTRKRREQYKETRKNVRKQRKEECAAKHHPII
ncbi:Retrotransposable element Tf2 protein type 1, partial [Aphis craccivora]